MKNDDIIIKSIYGACRVTHGGRYQKTYSIVQPLLFFMAFPLLSGMTVISINVEKFGVAIFFLISLLSIVTAHLIAYAIISKAMTKAPLDAESMRMNELRGVPIISWKSMDVTFIVAAVICVGSIFLLKLMF